MVAQSCLTLQPHGLQPSRLLCPWGSPGKNTGVGCHALLQGISLTQGTNPPLLLSLWQSGSLPLAPPGKSMYMRVCVYMCVCIHTHAPNIMNHDSRLLYKDA